MKKILITIITAVIFLLSSKNASADTKIVTPSAELAVETESEDVDFRVDTLAKFLQKYNSPLSPYANIFVSYADEYNLDYRLVPSITGVESTFGKRIPFNSFNAYGWANGAFYFDSWEHSIVHVSKTLREKYYDRGAENINKIAARYAPPSNSWGWKVKFFMNEIDNIPIYFDL